MADEAKTTFTLTPRVGNAQHFSSLDDLDKWIEAEREFWSFTQPDEFDRNEFSRQLRNAAASAFDAIRETANRYRKDPTAPNRQSLENQMQSFQMRMTSCSAVAQTIRLLAETDIELAGAAWYVATKEANEVDKQRNQFFTLFLRAVAHIEMATSGVHVGSVEAERESLRSVRDRWDSFVSEAATDIESYRDSRDKVSNALKTKFDSHDRKLNGLLQQSTERLEAIESTYKEELKLRSSVQYWTDRGRGCRIAAAVYTTLFLLTLAGVLGAMSALAMNWAIPEISQAAGKTPSYWPIGILAGLAGILMWPLRLLSRMIMSNMHLAADASERATMVSTYLALTDEGKADTEDRQLVLTHLFRSSATGIVKEDGAPTGLAEAISRLAAK